ncbi:MAG: hypothetical protein [Cressdnaviricota sp.]|nr:MAG: hypothetical protein [Cressdnaviricota sp.]
MDHEFITLTITTNIESNNIGQNEVSNSSSSSILNMIKKSLMRNSNTLGREIQPRISRSIVPDSGRSTSIINIINHFRIKRIIKLFVILSQMLDTSIVVRSHESTRGNSQIFPSLITGTCNADMRGSSSSSAITERSGRHKNSSNLLDTIRIIGGEKISSIKSIK